MLGKHPHAAAAQCQQLLFHDGAVDDEGRPVPVPELQPQRSAVSVIRKPCCAKSADGAESTIADRTSSLENQTVGVTRPDVTNHLTRGHTMNTSRRCAAVVVALPAWSADGTPVPTRSGATTGILKGAFTGIASRSSEKRHRCHVLGTVIGSSPERARCGCARARSLPIMSKRLETYQDRSSWRGTQGSCVSRSCVGSRRAGVPDSPWTRFGSLLNARPSAIRGCSGTTLAGHAQELGMPSKGRQS